MRPGGVRISARPTGLRVGPGLNGSGGLRGAITEFSDKSRSRLADVARDLGETFKAEEMVTITYPGEWRSVAGDGDSVKRHMKRLYGRMKRYFAGSSAERWAALWFLEFQQRGAPHFHLILWGVNFSESERRRFRAWLSRAWAAIVDHQDVVQRARHVRAGVRVERMRKQHFGYALKYAAKPEQKQVPDGFENVGRFWGLWNFDALRPAVFSMKVTRDRLERVVDHLAGVAAIHSPRFAVRLRGRFLSIMQYGGGFGGTVWGPEAVTALQAALDSS